MEDGKSKEEMKPVPWVAEGCSFCSRYRHLIVYYTVNAPHELGKPEVLICTGCLRNPAYDGTYRVLLRSGALAWRDRQFVDKVCFWR